MAGPSSIEWTEHTWNPVTGCTKVSPGCKNCYAERLAKRLKRMGASGYENEFEVSLHPSRLDVPIRRRVPTSYFVNSMSDLFHARVPNEFIDQIFESIELSPQHRFQILTKRAGRMAQYASKRAIPDHAWLGVSVENQRHGVPRIEHLRNIDCAVKFLSIEPLLEPLGDLNLYGISWVIVGGESGPRARPMNEEWVTSIRDQCERERVPFFFKQWGGRTPKTGGRILQGKTWDGMPENHGCSERISLGA